jgi:EmrB/QacA subfamily drug resistance transporter
VASRPISTLAVLFAGVLMAALDIAIVGPALPAIRAAFAVDSRALSWVFSIYVLFYLLGAPLLSKLSDRAGRRTVFGYGLGLFGAGSLVVAFAPSFELLLAGRAVQAFGAGGIFPIASALIADIVPVERRGRALGLLGAVFGVAFVLGPLLGGLLLRWGWQWLFLINVPIAALLIGLGRGVLPQVVAQRPEAFDASGAALLCLTLAALVWSINQIDSRALLTSLLSARVWPFALLALLAFPAFWSVEKRARDPMLHPDLFRSTQLRVVGAIAVAAGLVEAGMVFLPDLAVRGFGVAAPAASLMMLPLVATLIVGAPAAGYLLDRAGARVVIQTGLATMIVGLALFSLTRLTLTTFYAAGAAIGLGLSALLGAPLRYITLEEAGHERRGAGQGLLTLFLSIGQLLGAALIGGVVASSASELGGYKNALFALAVLCSFALLLSAALRRTQRSNPVDLDG